MSGDSFVKTNSNHGSLFERARGGLIRKLGLNRSFTDAINLGKQNKRADDDKVPSSFSSHKLCHSPKNKNAL